MRRRRFKFNRNRTTFPALILGVLLLFCAVGPSFTAALDVPATSHAVDDHQTSISADNLKPADCAGVTLSQLVSPGGTVVEPDSGALILADASTTSLTGGTGGDCIVGGAATTDINGGSGSDVCIGDATTNFVSCETEVRRP